MVILEELENSVLTELHDSVTELHAYIRKLPNFLYNQSITNDQAIGFHVEALINQFYRLFIGLQSGCIRYHKKQDLCNRVPAKAFAESHLVLIILQLKSISHELLNKKVYVEQISSHKKIPNNCESTLERELEYVLEYTLQKTQVIADISVLDGCEVPLKLFLKAAALYSNN